MHTNTRIWTLHFFSLPQCTHSKPIKPNKTKIETTNRKKNQNESNNQDNTDTAPTDQPRRLSLRRPSFKREVIANESFIDIQLKPVTKDKAKPQQAEQSEGQLTKVTLTRSALSDRRRAMRCGQRISSLEFYFSHSLIVALLMSASIRLLTHSTLLLHSINLYFTHLYSLQSFLLYFFFYCFRPFDEVIWNEQRQCALLFLSPLSSNSISIVLSLAFNFHIFFVVF